MRMKPKALLSVCGLALLLLSAPSMAESYEDGYAAYGRGDYATAFADLDELGRSRQSGPPNMALASCTPWAMACREMIGQRQNGTKGLL